MRLFSNLDFDRTSFWLGFLAGFLFLWLLGRLRPIVSRLFINLRENMREARLRATAGADIRLRNEALRRAQSLHLAAPLFSLDEILITPKLLAPPPPILPGEAAPDVDITQLVMPYLPDWSELPGRYRAPTLTVAEALQGNVSLVIIGRPGSGKSVALAQLASQMARREPLPGDLEKLTPLWVQAGELSLPSQNPEILLDALLGALGQSGAAATKARVAEYVDSALHSERALLILDGLDELPPADVDVICAYITKLKEQYPALHLVASASLEYYDGLTRLGCAPLAMASWDRAERAAFNQRWSEVWNANIQKPTQQVIDPDLINAWLLGESTPITPFEVTLKTWAAYAGDQLGATFTQAIEAYLRRMIYNKNMQPAPEARGVMEQIALRMALTGKPSLGRTELGTPKPETLEPAQEESPEADQEPTPSFSVEGKINAEPVLPLLLENGLLVAQANDRLKFNHSIICAYLAANAVNELVGVDGIFSGVEWTVKPGWDTRTTTLGFSLSLGNPLTKVIEKFFNQDRAPLHLHLFTLARWLPLAPAGTTWRSALLRRLASLLQDETLPLGLQTRAAAAIATSSAPGIGALLHQLSVASIPEQRQLAALAAGLYFDDKVAADKPVADRLIADISNLLSDLQLNVQRAACLGLVAMGNRSALEAVADTLLILNDDLRKSAAEALANHPEEGYPTLREGVTIDDILVRRAVVYGLARVREAWAVELLAKIQVEEDEWIVKNAATHALEMMKLTNPYLPRPLPELTETPWLIAYAGETGIGVSPGKPATELLLRALRDGKADQALAALDYLRLYGDDLAIPSIYQVMMNSRGEVQDACFNTLWHMAGAGIKLPSPESVLASV